MRSVRERSAGVIPFLKEWNSTHPSYLLIHSASVHNPRARWEFPKGGIERGESPRLAAAREFVEETGLRSWRFDHGFKRGLTYTYTRHGVSRIKTVVYFLAEVLDPTAITRSFEHIEDQGGRWYRWGRFDEVERLLFHGKLRALFRTADRWLRTSHHVGPASTCRPHRARAAEDAFLISSRGHTEFQGADRQ